MSVSPNSATPGQVRLDDLLQVCRNGGEIDSALLNEMLGLFISENRRRVETVTNAARSGNQHDLRAALHALKGSAALVGADRLRHLAARMEDDVASDTDHDAVAAGEELQREFTAVVATLVARYPDLASA